VGSSQSAPVQDVSVTEVWDRLASDRSSVLIDVRTAAEWTFVGVPDLSKIGKAPVLVEWQGFPDNRVNPQFESSLTIALDELRASKDDELFFICRSGARSRSAAQHMAVKGFQKCRNVAEGFEGPLDPNRHRGRASGWRHAGLPWVQS